MRDEGHNLLHEICALISHASDFDSALQEILQEISDQLNASICFISLTEDSSLQILAFQGDFVKERVSVNPIKNILELSFRRSKTINKSLKSFVSDCVIEQQDPSLRVNSLLSVPLTVSGTAIGVLGIGRRNRQAFPSRFVSVCEATAVPLASFIHNHTLTRQMQVGEKVLAENLAEHLPSNENDTLARAVFHGESVVSGVALGHAMLLAPVDSLSTLDLEKSNNLSYEQEVFAQALQIAKDGIEKITQESEDILAETDTTIFEMYQLLLDDPVLHEHINNFLEEGFTLNSALNLTFKRFSDEYQSFTDEYLKERLYDLKDVLLRIKNAATNIVYDEVGDEVEFVEPKGENKRIILVAQELLPTQLIASPLKQVCGIISESGGPTSHAAILAKALHIPMMIGGKGISQQISSGNSMLLDCQSGVCYIQPSTELLRRYRQPLILQKRVKQSAGAEITLSEPMDNPVTLDGETVQLAGNITLFSELTALQNVGVREIGLYRTEFMFMIRNAMPDENEQYRVISRLVQAAKGSPVTIRALDIGGDKPLPYVDWGKEDNPSLGWRGLRFLLSNPEFLHSHLRALLRTTALGPVNIMFPMVGDVHDLKLAKRALEKAQESLEKDSLPFDANYRFGIMLEVPSAVLALSQMLPLVDFVSIGTNDLIQYLFAVDRGNSKITRWYRQMHPVVLQVLQEICQKTAEFPDKTVTICGELAGQARAVPLLLGAGLRKFSMNSNFIPAVRAYVGKVSLQECQELFAEALKCSSEVEVLKILAEFTKRKKIDLNNLSG